MLLVSDLKFEYYCEYVPEILLALNKKLKLMGGAMKHFLKKLRGMKNLGLWSPGLQNIFQKICKTLQPPLHAP